MASSGRPGHDVVGPSSPAERGHGFHSDSNYGRRFTTLEPPSQQQDQKRMALPNAQMRQQSGRGPASRRPALSSQNQSARPIPPTYSEERPRSDQWNIDRNPPRRSQLHQRIPRESNFHLYSGRPDDNYRLHYDSKLEESITVPI